MRVRVLGCSGAIARGCKTTAFLVDHDMLIDAGTGVGDLTREEMLRIDDVWLTHAHLDHIACLPLLLDTVAPMRAGRPLRVHALPATLRALHEHIFNDVIWPNFLRLPSADAPIASLYTVNVGERRHIGGRTIEALPANHTVAACGYALQGPAPGAPWWVFSGDTEKNPDFWTRVNQLDVGALVIETAFSSHEREQAVLARHLSPQTLVTELDNIRPNARYPIYITHTKPAETQTIMREVASLNRGLARGEPHDIHWLSAGHVFEI
ncbi:MAG: 3',5'-cyclic-nucleotide phosphodiesterase [Burkholderiaceae bacterium]|jgi:ribonuclease BN (tRNA processing enzyme)|nr:3',5'-cyclic-nucleotide phosphodiesterase [Burkholderiaceae bacterium]